MRDGGKTWTFPPFPSSQNMSDTSVRTHTSWLSTTRTNVHTCARTYDGTHSSTYTHVSNVQWIKRTIRYGTVQYSTVQYSTVKYNAIQYTTVQCNTVHANSFLIMWCDIIRVYQTDIPGCDGCAVVACGGRIDFYQPCVVVSIHLDDRQMDKRNRKNSRWMDRWTDRQIDRQPDR